MKRMNENTKVVLTISQIKQLIKESKNVGDVPAFRQAVISSVKDVLGYQVSNLKCYYDGHDDYMTKRDFVIEGDFERRESGHYADLKAMLYKAISKAGGQNIIGRVMNGKHLWSGRNGGFDVAFDINPKKLAEYRQKEAEFKAKEDQEKADEMAIIQKEVDAFDVSPYKPNQKILDKITAYQDKGSKVNVKAITGVDKLLTYYYAAAINEWDALMREIEVKLDKESAFRYDKGLGVYVSIFPELSIVTKLQRSFRKLGWLWDEGGDSYFIRGILKKIKNAAKSESGPAAVPPAEEPPVEDEPEAPVEVSESTKVTLTIGQLKRLIAESKEHTYTYCDVGEPADEHGHRDDRGGEYSFTAENREKAIEMLKSWYPNCRKVYKVLEDGVDITNDWLKATGQWEWDDEDDYEVEDDRTEAEKEADAEDYILRQQDIARDFGDRDSPWLRRR